MPGRAPSWFAGAFASRAIASAMRFAADPPLVRLPVKPSHPMASATHRTTVRSMATAAGDDRHAVTFWFTMEAYRSPMAPTGSPDPITYAKSRPFPIRAASAMSARSSRTAKPTPSSGRDRSNLAEISATDEAGRERRLSRPARNSAVATRTASARCRKSSAERSRGGTRQVYWARLTGQGSGARSPRSRPP
jgi:hypothetical protein